MENDENVLSDEEITEQDKVADVKDEALRAEIAETLGLEDDDENKERIDKALEREKGLRSGYGKLLGKYKVLRGQTPPKPKEEKKPDTKVEGQTFDPEQIRKDAEAATLKTINENFLDDSDYSDETKAKIRDSLVRNPGKTVQWVMKNDDYTKFVVNQEAEAKRAGEAAKNGTGEGRHGKSSQEGEMPDKFTDPKFMLTEEGRKEYEEWVKNK